MTGKLLKTHLKNVYRLDARGVKNNELNRMDVPTAVVRQIESSELELDGYTEEGLQLVKNVILANDNRENNRRNADKRERTDRLKAVGLESETAEKKFTDISCQWPIILKNNDALEIHGNSELQRSPWKKSEASIITL